MLTPNDDLPRHPATDHPKWTERWYFNLLAENGTMLGIVGGGFYPVVGTLEVYACLLRDGVQHNLRQRVAVADRDRLDAASAVRFRLDEPMTAWTVSASGPAFDLDLRFTANNVPHLFPPFVVPADPPPASPAVFDDIQHFVQPGRFDGGLSFRDRTWGVRSPRPRLHSWYVGHLADGGYVTLIHQERADGTVMVSHVAHVDRAGAVRSAVVDGHDLSFEPRSRMPRHARYTARDTAGAAVAVSLEVTGPGVRLLGAGYTPTQGDTGGAEAPAVDAWDLSDPDLVATIGRGTIDSPARVELTWGDAGLVDGVGVFETAIARNHRRYGAQLLDGDGRDG